MNHILVVDDERWMYEGLKKIVSTISADFVVSAWAEDGLKALHLLREGEFSLILLDVRMPRMDGLLFLKELRRRGFTQPVVIITGYEKFEYAREALRLKAVDFLLKPLNKEELQETLLRVRRHLKFEEEAGFDTDGNEFEGNKNKQAIELICEQMEQYYMEPLSLSYYAEKTGYNASYLSRLFKQHTGEGFARFLTRIRIERANDLLLDEKKRTIEEISRIVGYFDEKHFIKTFKKEMGITPSDYRRQGNK